MEIKRFWTKEIAMLVTVPVPSLVRSELLGHMGYLKQSWPEKIVEQAPWSVVLAGFEVRRGIGQFIQSLCQPMPQSFVPTITVSHMGSGQKTGQIWAYAQENRAFRRLSGQLDERIQLTQIPLTSSQTLMRPHIHVANSTMPRLKLTDIPIAKTFVPKYLNVYQVRRYETSLQYALEGMIYIGP